MNFNSCNHKFQILWKKPFQSDQVCQQSNKIKLGIFFSLEQIEYKQVTSRLVAKSGGNQKKILVFILVDKNQNLGLIIVKPLNLLNKVDIGNQPLRQRLANQFIKTKECRIEMQSKLCLYVIEEDCFYKVDIGLYKCISKLNPSIITQAQKMNQSQQPHQPLSNQKKSTNSFIQSLKDPFRLWLNTRQIAFITKLLPTRYSFQLQPIIDKRTVSTIKIGNDQYSFMQNIKKIDSKEELKSQSIKNLSIQAQKNSNNLIAQEDQNAIYQNYCRQKESIKKSTDNVSQSMQTCFRILNLLKSSITSKAFRKPVDPIARKITNCLGIVRQPMDLLTVENNLKRGKYTTQTQFHVDIAKIITNSYEFCAQNIQLTLITAQFEKQYHKIALQLCPDIAIRPFSHEKLATQGLTSKKNSLELKKIMKQTKLTSRHQVKKISIAQIKELGQNINKLPKEYVRGVLDIVNSGKKIVSAQFDLQELDFRVIVKLQEYVREKLLGQNKHNQGFKKAESLKYKEPFEMRGQN